MMKPGFLFILLTAFPLFCRAAADLPFGDHVQLRGSLDNSRIQFERSKTGSVAFLGGSITEMDGYRPMVMSLLRQRFPETVFKFFNAGISSTTSATGAFRLESDVLSHGPIDLLFVEFAVNDDQDGHHTRAECIRAMEGIVRHARQSNPNIDIVITYFVNESMLKSLQSSQTPLTIEAHEAVAQHYHLPSIHLAAEVARQISAGSLTWKVYGGVHPAPAGNSICAAMIDELLRRSWTLPLPPQAVGKPSPMPPPLDAANFEHGRFINPSSAAIEHGFQLGVPDWKQIPGSKRDRFTSIPMLTATEPGAALTLKFAGTAIGAYVVAGPDAGVLEGTIDGIAFTPANLFHSYSKGLHYPRTVLFAADLKPGDHTLVLRVSSTTQSQGNAARIIQFTAN